ncbi:MAG: synthase subcomplex gamma subunit [Deltaproteobacteria bacterium]|jgi:F-type H+-transporting ATPase subunit gamma|nr:synthase subcomplex gamma subunit [Deltaproteobacteria bacterium]
MATLKIIRKRITSIRNTQQITKAMKMVSAAKLRRAQEAALLARPYADKMNEILINLSARVSRSAHPLLAIREEKRIQLVLVTSDRGLCGGYNANLVRAAEAFIRNHGAGKEILLVLVGRKGADYYRRRRGETGERYLNFLSTPAEELAAVIAEKLITRFVDGETDAVYLIYSHFRSALSQVPTVEKILPVALSETQEPEQLTEYLYEPGAEELLSSLLPRITEIKIQRALLEAIASEHGARMTAMDSATTNASKMMGSLTLQMNRARQASITRELMEIVGTAEALK